MLIRKLMQAFFHLLYHPFAFLYDFVAASVSWGQWTNWILETLPFLNGTRILELGHGPGYLQRALHERGYNPAALDESAQMSRIAARRLGGAHQLTRGAAQELPFANDSFDTVMATFPTEYIFDPRTLQSVYRVLRKNGRLIVLPVAFPKSGFLKWLYRITGESPFDLSADLQERLKQPFVRAGFFVEPKIIATKNSQLLVLLADKR